MGSDDVKLKYIDDEPDSYPNIFSSAKTELSETDRQRLIAALKPLLSVPRRKRADAAIRLLRLIELLPMMTDGTGGGFFGL